MDLNYSYSLISFTLGILSGIQFIAKRHEKSGFRAIRTWAGLAYLVLRGLFSAVVFVAFYASSFYWSSQRPFLWAIICGTGAEYLLRSKVFVLEKKDAEGQVEAVMWGPIDLLMGFQDYFLKRVEERVEEEKEYENEIRTKEKISKANARNEFIIRNMPPGTFEEFRQMVNANLHIFEDRLPEQVREIRQAGDKLNAEYAPAGKAPTYDEGLKRKLGFLIVRHIYEEGFLALVGKHEDRLGKP